MPTPFEAGKTAKELGIDTSRKFVVVNADQTHERGEHGIFKNGDRLTYVGSIDDLSPYFTREADRIRTACAWSRLAYADDETKPEAYEPRVGDRILVEATVCDVDRSCVKPLWRIRVADSLCAFVDSEDLANAKLLPPRTLPKAEAEALLTEKLGESVRIEN